jgi:hypothetical protein
VRRRADCGGWSGRRWLRRGWSRTRADCGGRNRRQSAHTDAEDGEKGAEVGENVAQRAHREKEKEKAVESDE